ncbi:hypothetical protein [Corynebacterium kutscheri]|nr:hypothetical protein [Corynebacterium kutscheri]VEH06127.1 Uncharacterised protein [Corynebacterium kutscheri]
MNYFIQADMRCVHQLAFLISVIESLYGNKGVFWVGGRIDSRKQRPFISEPVSDFRRRLNQYRGEATVVWLNMKSEHAGTCGKENCCSDNHDYQSVEYAHEYSPADIARQLGEESVVSLFSMQPCLGHPIVERLSQRMNIVVSCNPIERFIEDLAQVYTRAGIDPELAYEQFQIAMRSDQDEFVLETVQPAIDDPVDNTGMNVKRHYEVVARLPLVQRPFEETGNFHAHSSKSLEIINLKLLLPLFKLANALRSKYFGDDGDLRKID